MRDDLLALTPDAVAALTNAGLAKRAVRDLAAGRVPAMRETDDGTVIATFDDDQVARLPRGLPLRLATCTCPSTATCRHRVTAALAYRGWLEGRRAEDGPGSAVAEPSPSPAAIPDEALRAACGAHALAEAASAIRGKEVVVELVEGPPPGARLPTATVRFFVPGQVAHAGCDCRQGGSCVHVVLAVWAFRRAEEEGRGPAATVTLASGPARAAAGDADALAAARALARWIVVEGVATLPDAASSRRFAAARDALRRARAVWVEHALDEVARHVGHHRERSARYRAADVVQALVEIEGRARAATGSVALPAAFVLGRADAEETDLDHLQLVAVGSRVDAHGADRDATVFLAEPGSGTVLVAARTWQGLAGTTGADLAGRSFLARAPLGVVARGGLVSRRARRHPDRGLSVTSGAGNTSVMAVEADWASLPEPLLVPSVARLRRAMIDRPPRMLRPRLRAEDLHVVAISAIVSLAHDPGDQVTSAIALDAEGEPYTIERAHRAVTPAALDALAFALSGFAGAPRYVTGEVRLGPRGIVVDPMHVVADRVVVLDLELAQGHPALPIERRPRAGRAGLLERARGVLDASVHHGLRATTAEAIARWSSLGSELAAAGHGETGRRIDELASATAATRDEGSPAALDRAAGAWLEAGIRIAVALERDG